MAFYNGVYETSVTTGTGAYTLAGAFIASGATVSAYQTFAVVGDGKTCYYRAQDNENGGWEYGVGTYTASGTTLARTTILGSSNANAAVNWPAGTRQIFLIDPAELHNVFSVGLDGRITINVSGSTSPVVGVSLQQILPDTLTSASMVGYLSAVSTNSTNTHNQTFLKGVDLIAEHDGSGTIILICGGDFDGEHYGSALATSVVGGRGIAHNQSTGAITNMDGFRALWGNYGAGTVASAAGFRTVEDSGGGPITANYGFIVPSLTMGTTNYGFYSGIAAAANTYAFHGAGTAVSYFGGQVGVGVAAPNASALFQIDSTTKGTLPPRMTTAQKAAISNPAEGLTVYDTDLHAPCFWNGSVWKTVATL